MPFPQVRNNQLSRNVRRSGPGTGENAINEDVWLKDVPLEEIVYTVFTCTAGELLKATQVFVVVFHSLSFVQHLWSTN